jgi:dienelactone hydrolase
MSRQARQPRSGLSARAAAHASVAFDEVRVAHGAVWWLQSLPEEGRTVLMRRRGAGPAEEVTPPGADVGTAAHGYGGGAYAVDAGRIWYVEAVDGQLHMVDGAGARPVAGHLDRRATFGDLTCMDGHLLCVREDTDGDQLVRITSDGSTQVLAGTAGFFAAPRPRGGRLTWLHWSTDQMPWDGSELLVASYDAGGLGPVRRVAGGGDESVVQPDWAADGGLLFVSDRTGWWNLYHSGLGSVRPVAPMAADIAPAAWEFGYASYVELAGGRIAATVHDGPRQRLVVFGPDEATTTLATPYTSFKPYLARRGTQVVAIVASPVHAPHVVAIDVDDPARREVIAAPPADRGELPWSQPELIDVPTPTGPVSAALYPPVGAGLDWSAPLVVRAHPGPTASVSLRLDWHVQFLASHGFAVVDVNYRGSTGYGRRLRQSLYGRWGSFDVEDCAAAAARLIEMGRTRRGEVFIAGASAGGYTALRAVSRSGVFAGAVARSAIVDPRHWQQAAPRWQRPHAARLAEGAPAVTATGICRPVLLIHGEADTVAPLDDVTALAHDLAAAGRPHRLVVLAASGHHRAGQALQEELDFYRSLLGA